MGGDGGKIDRVMRRTVDGRVSQMLEDFSKRACLQILWVLRIANDIGWRVRLFENQIAQQRFRWGRQTKWIFRIIRGRWRLISDALHSCPIFSILWRRRWHISCHHTTHSIHASTSWVCRSSELIGVIDALILLVRHCYSFYSSTRLPIALFR